MLDRRGVIVGGTVAAASLGTAALAAATPRLACAVEAAANADEYLRANFHLTTSGMNWGPAINQALAVMGPDRVMFAADWPFEDATDAAQRFRALKLISPVRDKLAYRNAEHVFGIAA